MSVDWTFAALDMTAGLKVPLTPPVADRILYCFCSIAVVENTASTVAPPSVAVPVTLVRPALAEETWIR